jgi:hypothetical protein
MRPRILVFLLVAGLLSASVAVAKERPRPDMAGDTVTASGCKPKRALILRGTFLSGGPDSFQMEVRKANRLGRALRGTRELKVDARTKFRRNGNAATLASLQPNDRLNVHVRGCKRAQAMSMELLARRVVAHPAKPS